MSYSTYMTVYDEGEGIEQYLQDVVLVCRKLYKPKLEEGGYWDADREDYVGDPYDYIRKSIERKREGDTHKSYFCFCNHDGCNDEEIFKCFFLFAKVLSSFDEDLVINLMSQHEDPSVYYFINENRVYNRSYGFSEESEYFKAIKDEEKLKEKVKSHKDIIKKKFNLFKDFVKEVNKK